MTVEQKEQTEGQQLWKITPEQLNPELVRRLPLEFLKKQQAIPIVTEEGRIAVALADLLNTEAYDAIVSVLGQPCLRVQCPPSEIDEAISQCYYQQSEETPAAPLIQPNRPGQ